MPFTNKVKTDTVAVRDSRVTYFDSGSDQHNAETIVMLYGMTGTAEGNFWALFPMLSLRHRVVTFDFNDATHAVDLDSRIAQTKAVIDVAAPDGQVHVVGHSLGAVVAALFAARYPGRVKSLTLVAGWARTDTHQRIGNEIGAALWRAQHPSAAAFEVYRSFSPAFLNAKNEAEVAELMHCAAGSVGHAENSTSLADVDIRDDIIAIVAPSLVVGCTRDLIAPVRHSKMLFGGIKDCRFAQIESGHAVVLERPAELFRLIEDFVQSPHATAPGQVIQPSHS